MTHYTHDRLHGAMCGESPDFGYTKCIDNITCEGCLEALMFRGEEAANRLAIVRVFEATKQVALKYVDKIAEEKVLVHADGGDCHGTILLLTDGGGNYCPGCGISPDMQSTEFWPRSKVKDDWRTRELNGDSW